MIEGNPHFSLLDREYIFPIIEKKLLELQSSTDDEIVNAGIGDIALPLAPTIAKAICDAVIEMSISKKPFGYGPSEGYLFLREAIRNNSYKNFTTDEIFISDGINTDILSILDLFKDSCTIAIPTPAYPAYLDATILSGKKDQIIEMPCTFETGFIPELPEKRVDIIYLTSPHNPTGVAMPKDRLRRFVEFAKSHGSIILYDGAYESFISSNCPKTIYEVEGAEEVALEFRSFSKSAGFTGLRCSYTVIPKSVQITVSNKFTSLNLLWKKRQSIKFNGVAYPIQKGAFACFSQDGSKEISEQVQIYKNEARTLLNGLLKLEHTCFGGIDSPYIWWKAPEALSSWEFFDLLLKRCHLVTVPGIGFGKHGDGYVRLSTFMHPGVAEKALSRISHL